MPRPTTKADLIAAASEQYDKMWKLIRSISIDVLTHLHEWHELLINWAVSNRNGANKPFLPEPYTWKTYGDMNAEF